MDETRNVEEDELVMNSRTEEKKWNFLKSVFWGQVISLLGKNKKNI